MKKSIQIRNIADLSQIGIATDDLRSRVNCMRFDAQQMSVFEEPFFLKATTAVLVLSGTAEAVINYHTERLEAHNLVLLSASHRFQMNHCSADFLCVGLFVSRDFTDEMDSTDMVYKRIRYEVKLFRQPLLSLSSRQTEQLRRRLESIADSIAHPEHLYYKEVVLNCLMAFYLDLSDVIDRREELPDEGGMTRQESIIKAFIELLTTSFRKEHKVEFYASQLHISTHYLTLIVKRVTGQSVSDFIFEMLFSEARNLLQHSRLSVQEIALELNFSDQSAFGKFFKRKSGVAPADYRKQS